MRLRSWTVGFGRDERGGVAIMAAAFGLIICAMAALAVDVGSVVLTARKVQSTADLAAMSAARDLDRARQAAEATAGANLSDISLMTVQKGRYTPDPKLKPDNRFKAQATQVNAAKVELTASAKLYFSRFIVGNDHWPITRTATAALPDIEPRVMFSIGTRLASLNDGVVNKLLSGLLGSNVSVDLVAYNGLANVDVNLLQFSNLLGTRLGVKAGDYDALLKHEATAGDLLKVVELVAASNNSALSTIAAVPVGAKVKLGDLIGVDADAMDGLADHLNVNVSALDLIMATLETANEERQLALDLGVKGGLIDVDAIVLIGQRPQSSPWLTITNTDEPVIRTAQARVYLSAETISAASGLLGTKIPILIQVAGSEAKLSSLKCEGLPTATLAIRPGLASVGIGEFDKSQLNNFAHEMKPTDVVLATALGGTIKIIASVHTQVGDEDWQTRSFTETEVKAKTVKSVRSKKFIAGTVGSLLKNLNLRVQLGPSNALESLLSGLINGLIELVKPLLLLVAPLLDAIVQPLLELLGVRLGEADVRVHNIDCGQIKRAPKLVI